MTITGTDTLRRFSTENPVFQIKYNGFAYVDNADLLVVKPIISCSAEKASQVGSCAISVSGASESNYDFVYVDGKLTVIDDTGLEDVKCQFSIYPNPVRQQLNVVFFEPVNNIKVILETITGQKIFEKSIQSANKIQLTCSNLSSGVYNVKFLIGNQILIRRIVKQ